MVTRKTAWSELRKVFNVSSIMTPAYELLSANQESDISKIRDEAKEKGFDLIPAKEKGRIVGVWCTDNDDLDYEPLKLPWLVSADAGIPTLLRLFIESAKPGLFVIQRQSVVGIVTPADLNKTPARMYLYNLLAEFELALADYIRQYCLDDPEWFVKHLCKGRRNKIQDEFMKLRRQDVDAGLVQLLHLSDLNTIIAKEADLRERLGYESEEEAQKHLGAINHLRNRTMHLVEPLLMALPDDLPELQTTIREARKIIKQFENESLRTSISRSLIQPPDSRVLHDILSHALTDIDYLDEVD